MIVVFNAETDSPQSNAEKLYNFESSAVRGFDQGTTPFLDRLVFRSFFRYPFWEAATIVQQSADR
ncbi:MAG TPA: hypothetical protein DEP53_04190 [Bacteroidetes bacterium]|nr:hypothetical protein [Bacteroidota bacterium]